MSRLHNTTSTDVDESRCARELLSDPAAVTAFLQRLMRPGDVHEIRIPHPRRGGPRRLYRAQAGYFDRAETAGLAVRGIGGGDAAGVYVTLNPVLPTLLARSDNVLRDADTTAGDKDIARRTNLLIDCDPVRHPADVSATDEEMALAVERRDLVIAYLRDLGWPEPVAVAMSGNGGSAIYRVELANDDDATALVKRVLAALDHLFSDERVIVDASNFNASRLTKLVGTVAAKGDDFQGRPGVPARPWRSSTATYPEAAGVVTREQLAALAALAPVDEPERRPLDAGWRGAAQRTWTVEQLLELNSLTARRKQQAYATVWQLERCPTSSEHTSGAILFEMLNGAVGYRCLHNSCSNWNWQRLREEGLIAIPGEAARNGHKQKQDTLSALNALNAQAKAPADAGARKAIAIPDLDPAALYGLAGEIVGLEAPSTEAHPAALLLNTLAMAGNVVGRQPHTVVANGATHRANINVAIVGKSRGGRKGTAAAVARGPFVEAFPEWCKTRVVRGLSSGEGLIGQVRDRVTKTGKDGLEIELDAGVSDKRLCVHESEFGAIFKVMAREGNTLSMHVRAAFDGEDLSALTRTAQKATAPHITIIGQITPFELDQLLPGVEVANGFANRFLWVYVHRRGSLPRGNALDESELKRLARKLREALDWARSYTAPINFDVKAGALWVHMYESLVGDDAFGLAAEMTSRGEAIVARLALIYAILDKSHAINVDHLAAAFAVWQYCEQSAYALFGDKTGDPVADRVIGALRQSAGGLDTDSLRDVFSRHVSSKRLADVLDRLEQSNVIASKKVETKGRPRTIYCAVSAVSAERGGATALTALTAQDYMTRIRAWLAENHCAGCGEAIPAGWENCGPCVIKAYEQRKGGAR